MRGSFNGGVLHDRPVRGTSGEKQSGWTQPQRNRRACPIPKRAHPLSSGRSAGWVCVETQMTKSNVSARIKAIDWSNAAGYHPQPRLRRHRVAHGASRGVQRVSYSPGPGRGDTMFRALNSAAPPQPSYFPQASSSPAADLPTALARYGSR